jgi:hypothetical protein
MIETKYFYVTLKVKLKELWELGLKSEFSLAPWQILTQARTKKLIICNKKQQYSIGP